MPWVEIDTTVWVEPEDCENLPGNARRILTRIHDLYAYGAEIPFEEAQNIVEDIRELMNETGGFWVPTELGGISQKRQIVKMPPSALVKQ